MITTKKIVASATLAAAILGVLGFAAPSAQAAPAAAGVVRAAGGYERCPKFRVCIFDGANGTGKMAYFSQGSQNLGLQGMDNMASSWWNRTGRAYYGYDGYGSNRGRYVFGDDGHDWGTFNLYGSEDNTMSSIVRG